MYKQYVIVPKSPKMSAGKIASQVAHATMMALEKYRAEGRRSRFRFDIWKDTGMTVIVLQARNTLHLTHLSMYLDTANIANHMYIDEGKTEVEAGTPTALATGLIDEDNEWRFKGLKLFK